MDHESVDAVTAALNMSVHSVMAQHSPVPLITPGFQMLSDTQLVFGFGEDHHHQSNSSSSGKSGKSGRNNIKERKTVDDFLQRYPTELSIVQQPSGDKTVMCVVCPQTLSWRTDRIREHLNTKRHEERKQRKERQGQGSGERSESPVALHQNYPTATSVPPVGAEEVVDSQPHFRPHSVANSSSGSSGGRQVGPCDTFAHQQRENSLVHLKWSFFQPNMANMFDGFRKCGKFIDVTICVEGRTISCHKLVLASCSTYFERLLVGTIMETNPHPVVALKDMKFWEVSALVEFMYHGELDIPEEHLEDLIEAAKVLEVKGIWVQNAFNTFSTSGGTGHDGFDGEMWKMGGSK